MYDAKHLTQRFSTSHETLYRVLDTLGVKPAYRGGGGGKAGIVLWNTDTIDSQEGRILSEIKRLRFEGRSAGAKAAHQNRLAGNLQKPDRLASIEEKLDRLLALWAPKEGG